MTSMKRISSPELLFEYLNPEELMFYEIAALPTEDDLLYDDGAPMETQRHRDQMNILIDSLKDYWKDSRDYYVGGNMFLHFDLSNKRIFKGPDVFLVLDVDPRERKSWVVWQEGGRFPDVIIELLSVSTHKTDKGEKKDLYEQVFKTSEYYLYDPFSQEFMGYRLTGDRYVPVLPDSERRIYSAATGLALVIHGDRLRWMTAAGMILPTGMELAEQEKQRADQAEGRLLKTARQMLDKGFTFQEIYELTGLSRAELAM